MGAGNTSSVNLDSLRVAARASRGGGFTHSMNAQAIHPDLDPRIPNAEGKHVRESVASADHPDPIPVVVALDITGSMADQPQVAADKLGELYALIKEKGYIDPHISFAAIADYTDRAVLQSGQFEADARILESLQKIWLAGGGGGSAYAHEAYELLFHYYARHTVLDAEAKGKKGYFFLIADEMANATLEGERTREFIGISGEDVSLQQILRELKKKFHVFYVLPRAANHGENPEVIAFWQKLLGENLIRVEDLSDVSAVIAGAIGLLEGVDLYDVVRDIAAVSGPKTARAAEQALVAFQVGASVVKGGQSNLPPSSAGGAPERL